MAYTTPTDVQTKADAVLALASTIADEDKTALGNGSVNKALDVLADVLAQQDVSVPQTNAGAILALAQYVGGGGASLTGNLAELYAVNDEPSEYPQESGSALVYVAIGGRAVADGSISRVIAGADVTSESAPSGAWLLVPTSVTLDPSTGRSIEFTKTALTITENTVHIPDDIPEPLTVEYEVEGETYTDYFYPCICIAAGESPK